MVKIMENPIKMDDLGGPPLFLETPTSWKLQFGSAENLNQVVLDAMETHYISYTHEI